VPVAAAATRAGSRTAAISSASAVSLRSGLTSVCPISAVAPSTRRTTSTVAMPVTSAESNDWCWRNWLRDTICVAMSFEVACISSTTEDWSWYHWLGAVVRLSPPISSLSCGKMACGLPLSVVTALSMSPALVTRRPPWPARYASSSDCVAAAWNVARSVFCRSCAVTSACRPPALFIASGPPMLLNAALVLPALFSPLSMKAASRMARCCAAWSLAWVSASSAFTSLESVASPLEPATWALSANRTDSVAE
jgi:hypothetical protein